MIFRITSGAIPFFSIPARSFTAHFFHPLGRAMKAERASQFLRFGAGKIGHDHRDLEHLLLEKRHA